jgi:hypothetical protein
MFSDPIACKAIPHASPNRVAVKAQYPIHALASPPRIAVVFFMFQTLLFEPYFKP